MSRRKLPPFALALAACAACAHPTPPSPVPAAAAPVPAAASPPEAAAPRPAPAAPQPAPADYRGLGADSIPPELIARFAPPPVAPALADRIRRMLDIRGAVSGQLTRDGRRMVFGWSITGTTQVWRQDGPLGFPIQLTGGEAATWVQAISPDDRFAVVSRDPGGTEDTGLYLLALDGGPLIEIQHLPGVQTLFAFISDDSRAVYFASNDLDPKSYALHRWDRATGRRDTLLSEPGTWQPLDHTRDRVLLARYTGRELELFELALGTRALTRLLRQDDVVDFQAAYAARPGALIVRTNQLGDRYRLYEWAAGELTPITPELAADVSYFAIDRARTRIVYGVNQGSYQRIAAIDAARYRPLAAPALPDAEWIGVHGITPDGRFTVIGHQSSARPAAVSSHDWVTGKTVTWRVGQTPEIDRARLVGATLEHYPARDGTRIPMLVRRPARCAPPCPVIVEFHGGPESVARADFTATSQVYVAAGFIYVEPNVRGSGGHGKAWLAADDGPRRRDVITDVEDCARHIRTAWAHAGRAPRIGVLGGSYGGYAAAMAMTYFAGAYDAGVARFPVSNLVSFLENTAPRRRAGRIAEWGDPVRDRDVLLALSPSSYLDRLAAPLLVIAGVNDPRNPVGESIQLHAALTARGATADLILFPGEGHGLLQRDNQVRSLAHTLLFFERHLRDPAPPARPASR